MLYFRYVITPAKKYLPATEFNYDISDIKSDDSTDEEDKPRKEIPKWAKGNSQWYVQKQLYILKIHVLKSLKTLKIMFFSSQQL